MPSKSEIRAVAALSDAKERVATGKTLLEGPHLVFEGLRRGRALHVYVSEDYRERDALVAAAAEVSVPCEVATPDDVARMAGVKTPAGVVATARRNEPIPLARLLSEHAFAVAFDAVQDPGNVGAIARTAAALGVRALIFTPGTADATAPKSLRASAGALIDAPYAEAASLDDLASALAPLARPIVVADTRGGEHPRALALLKSGVFVFGNEGAGVRLGAVEGPVVRATIPLEEGTESLNVAAAAAILLDRRRG